MSEVTTDKLLAWLTSWESVCRKDRWATNEDFEMFTALRRIVAREGKVEALTVLVDHHTVVETPMTTTLPAPVSGEMIARGVPKMCNDFESFVEREEMRDWLDAVVRFAYNAGFRLKDFEVEDYHAEVRALILTAPSSANAASSPTT